MCKIDAIQQKIKHWADECKYELILTSGGTGFGPRDMTPEAIRPLLHREAPGLAQALLSEGLKHTAMAVLSRPVAGTRNNTLIVSLPGRYFYHSVISDAYITKKFICILV